MKMNQRKKTLLLLIISVTFLTTVAIAGIFLHDSAMVTDFSRKNLAPCLQYPFGTDWLGRDMFHRTITGLSMSILIGVNDVWHEFEVQNGVDAEKYYKIYSRPY